MKKLLSTIVLFILVIALTSCGEEQPCNNTVKVILTDESEFIYEDVCSFGIQDYVFIEEDVYVIKMNQRNQYGETVSYPIDLIQSIGYIIQEDD